MGPLLVRSPQWRTACHPRGGSRSGRPEIRRITIAEHARILNAIKQRDPESAAIAMSTHLQGARERMSDED